MEKSILLLMVILSFISCNRYYITQNVEPNDILKNTCRVETYVYENRMYDIIVYTEYSKDYHSGYGISCDDVVTYKKEAYKRAEKAIKILEEYNK